MANFIVTKTDCGVYGGYLRDYVYRGDLHGSVDLDVSLPLNQGKSVQWGVQLLKGWATGLTPPLVCTRMNPKGPLVHEMFFLPPGGSSADEFPVEVVDSEAFASKFGPQLDFDVNNLKAHKAHGRANPLMTLKRPEQGPTMEGVLAHVRSQTLLVLKPPQEVSDRITKMKSRGWAVEYP